MAGLVGAVEAAIAGGANHWSFGTTFGAGGSPSYTGVMMHPVFVEHIENIAMQFRVYCAGCVPRT
jgi:hypothetical protein